jgi:peptide deformylase
MAMRPILRADSPLVRQKAHKVKEFDDSLRALVEDMVKTMRAAPGIGLAATQVGVSLRVIVVELAQEEEPETERLYVLVNPEIVKARGEEEGEEGCLSLPGYVGEVKRASVVTVKGRDLKGREIRIKAKGLLARVLQHEIDHLDGMLFTDHLESLDRLRRLEPREREIPI